MEFKKFCSEYCAYNDNEPKEHMEPCLNCPLEHWLDLKGEEIQVTVTWGKGGRVVRVYKPGTYCPDCGGWIKTTEDTIGEIHTPMSRKKMM